VCVCVCYPRPQQGIVSTLRKASRVLRGSRVNTYRKASRHRQTPKIISYRKTQTVLLAHALTYAKCLVAFSHVIQKPHRQVMINVCNELMKLAEKQNYLCMFDTITMICTLFSSNV